MSILEKIDRCLRLTAALAVALALSLAATVAADSQSTITEASIRGHLEFLASDALQGRGSGTHDEQLAANYIGSQMRGWGIEPLGDNGGYVQEVKTSRAVAQTPPILTVQNLTFRSGPDIAVAGVSSGASAGPLYKYEAGQPVPAGSFVLIPEGESVPPTETSGAAGVMTVVSAAGAGRGARGGGGPAAGAPRVDPRSQVCGGTKSQEAARQAAADAGGGTRGGGAAGAAPGGGARPGGAGGGRGGAAPNQWRITLSADTFAKIKALPNGDIVSITADLKSLTWNAIGRIKGSDSAMTDDVILLSAHLDHLGVRGVADDYIYNGADDDASGSTAVLELAEAIAKGPRPKRTVIFAWFGSEESGGFGARHFLDQPPVPLKQIVANIEFEMIGRADPMVPPQSLWLTGYECSDLGDTLAKRGARIVQDPRPEQRFFNRSDNIQLARRGIVAQTVSSFNLHTDYHHASDEVKLVDFAHMTRSIQSMLEPVRWLLNSNFKPKWREGMCPLPCGG